MNLGRVAIVFVVASGLLAGPAAARSLKIAIDGDRQTAFQMTEQLNKHGKDHDLRFTLVTEDYEFRIAVYTEGASTADFLFGGGGADSAAVVLSPKCELLFLVSRSGRITQGGALNAVSKELVKRFKRYLDVTTPK